MFYVVKYLYDLVKQVYAEHADPRVQDWPLIYSPLPVLTVIALYLAYVLHYGPKWMEKCEPFQLKLIMRIYNAVQVIANISLFLYVSLWNMIICMFDGNKLEAIPNSYGHKNFSFRCQTVDPTNTEPWMIRCLYVTYGYYLTKFLDLFDTIFIVLRKKNQQITFLHVYHHAGMVLGVYIYITFLPCSHSTMLGVVNLFIHTVMYAYYFAASLNATSSALWWKRHITQLQLIQFGYLALHFLQVVLHNPCKHPMLVAIVGFMQNIFMFALFFEFYYRSYMKVDKSKSINCNAKENKAELKAS